MCVVVLLPMPLSYKQFWCLKNRGKTLFSLLEKRPMDTMAVANKLGIHRTTASHYLNRLVKDGRLVKRKKGKVTYYGIKRRQVGHT